jgi:hypothetical protein
MAGSFASRSLHGSAEKPLMRPSTSFSSQDVEFETLREILTRKSRERLEVSYQTGRGELFLILNAGPLTGMTIKSSDAWSA